MVVLGGLEFIMSEVPLQPASEPRCNKLTHLKDVCLKAKARFWPGLSYMFHIRLIIFETKSADGVTMSKVWGGSSLLLLKSRFGVEG